MATGTGKTAVAFQICWKLWNMRWNRAGEHRRPGQKGREAFLRETRAGGASDSRRSLGKIRRARYCAVRYPRRSQGPADFGAGQRDRDRRPFWRAGITKGCSGRVAGAAVRRLTKTLH